MEKSTAALFLLLIGVVAGAAITAQQFNNQSITLLGNFEAYSNNARLLNGSTLDWGVNHAGTLTRTLDLHNIDNRTCIFNLYVANLPANWTESWTGNGTSVAPDMWVRGNLTLTVPAGTKGTFEFGNMVIVSTAT